MGLSCEIKIKIKRFIKFFFFFLVFFGGRGGCHLRRERGKRKEESTSAVRADAGDGDIDGLLGWYGEVATGAGREIIGAEDAAQVLDGEQ